MPMTFTPKSEKEVNHYDLLPDGEYDFEVLDSSPDVSKRSGRDMIKLKIGLFLESGKQRWVYDYLIGSAEAKLRHFCDTTGTLAKYESGTLSAADCKGLGGRCKIRTKKDDTGKYPPKNEVADYVCRKAKPIAASSGPTTSAPAEAGDASGDDDVPF